MTGDEILDKLKEWHYSLENWETGAYQDIALRYHSELLEAVTLIDTLMQTAPDDQWRNLADRFFEIIRKAGGPHKSSEVLTVTYHPQNEVSVDLGTYSIGSWPRHTGYISTTRSNLTEAEAEAFRWARLKVEEADKAEEIWQEENQEDLDVT